MDLSAIGSRIKAARERKHLTQEDLAAIVDLSPTHISVIERGVKPPKLETFVNIANALNVPFPRPAGATGNDAQSLHARSALPAFVLRCPRMRLAM